MSFLDEALKAACAAARKYKLTPYVAAVATAQACLESGYGKYVGKDVNTGKYSYNLFGIKGTGPAGSVVLKTWEVYDGKKVNIQAKFRSYHNYTESFEDYMKLISTARFKTGGPLIYQKALDVKDDPDAYARSIQACGYATDPDYAKKLIAIMDRERLREKAKEEYVNMELADWQKEAGEKALDSLSKKNLVSNPDEWKEKLAENVPNWLLFVMLDRITKAGPGV